MSIEHHTLEVPDGFTPSRTDRMILGVLEGVANGSGANGATVSVAVSLPAGANLPANFAVLVNPGQGVGWYVNNKTSSGFTVNLVPFAGTVAVAAGSFDCVLVA